MKPLTRRDMLKMSAAALPAGAVFAHTHTGNAAELGGIPKRRLGKTEEMVSMLCLGGYHVGSIEDEQEAIRVVRRSVDSGVNFLDNAWTYHDGRSEEIMGKALRDGYRDRAFIMSKVLARDKDGAREQLEASLTRYQTDMIDLWQFHSVKPGDADKIFGPDGAMEVALEALDSGKIRYLGFTGHTSYKAHLEMLAKDYDWKTVQMPLNPLDPHYDSFEKNVLPILLERDIGVIAMKSFAGGRLLENTDVTPEEAHRYVYSLPVSTLVSGMDSMEYFENNYNLALDFEPMSDDEKQALLARTRDVGITGESEYFKEQRG